MLPRPATTSPAKHLAVVSRVAAAVLGGYGLAALTSLAALALPLPATEAVLAGMLASFLVWTGAVIWIFAASSAWRAWAGLVAATLPLMGICAMVLGTQAT